MSAEERARYDNAVSLSNVGGSDNVEVPF